MQPPIMKEVLERWDRLRLFVSEDQLMGLLRPLDLYKALRRADENPELLDQSGFLP